jgi:hypothetical protein
MAYTDKCKGCTADVNVSSEAVKVMINEIVESGNFILASEEEYMSRLKQCSTCKYLKYATTCLQCGCIVQVRALLEDKDCPCPGVDKWK